MTAPMPRFFGVIGDPVGHSRSPAMHQEALRVLGIAGHYAAFHVQAKQLRDAILGASALGFDGLNVTVPHKAAALQCATRRSHVAERIGATNTLHFVDGQIVAHNTDAAGFLHALQGVRASPVSRALVLGAGGASRAVVDALTMEAQSHVHWVSRDPMRVEIAPEWHAHVTATSWDALVPNVRDRMDLSEIDLIVNTTTVGMEGGPSSFPVPLDLDRCRDDACVIDVVVSAPGQATVHTPLLREADRRGLTAADGRSMLLWQGVRALEIWLGISLEPEVVAAMARTLKLDVEHGV